MVTILPLFIIAISLFSLFRKRGIRAQQDTDSAFWEREEQANSVRRKDISNLPYLTIPLNHFPIGICKTDEISVLESTLTELSGQKILNLGRQTNTDLKLLYGTANIGFLTQYSDNYLLLCRTLTDYAAALHANGYDREAVTVLEYEISTGSDSSTAYSLLADLYISEGRPSAIDSLIAQADALDSLMRAPILAKLAEKQAS